jgi:hypothetical protein
LSCHAAITVALREMPMTTVALLRPVLSAGTIVAIENRMLMGAAAAMAQAAAVAALRPSVARFIPYLGWALTIGAVAYASYEAYSSRDVGWSRLEAETYTADDLAVFMAAFTQARQAFATRADGIEAQRRGQEYILILSEVMPMIAEVDGRGLAQFGASLRWDPANGPSRRQAALRGREPAGQICVGTSLVRGSWEEYPFASTSAARAGFLVDRVPLRENWIQGGFIGAASIVQAFREGDAVPCFIL